MLDVNFFFPTFTRPYFRWSDRKLVDRSHYVFTCTNGHEDLTSLADEITAYGLFSDTFRDKVAIAANREKTAIIEKDLARFELITATLNLAHSIASIAKGDIRILGSVGLELRKKPQSVSLGDVSNLVITAPNHVGQLKTKVDKVTGARSYLVKYTLDLALPISQWSYVTCTTLECFLMGLESGLKYWIKVGAVGAKGKTHWSEAQRSPFVA